MQGRLGTAPREGLLRLLPSLLEMHGAQGVAACASELSTQVLPPLAPPFLQDLYVLRRAVGVYERLVKRFTAQTTD